jgi:hypothetical protein
MAKLTQKEKLDVLTAKLEKAKKSRERINAQIKALNDEIASIEEKTRIEVANSLLADKEKLKSMFDLGVLSQEQYEALTK